MWRERKEESVRASSYLVVIVGSGEDGVQHRHSQTGPSGEGLGDIQLHARLVIIVRVEIFYVLIIDDLRQDNLHLAAVNLPRPLRQALALVNRDLVVLEMSFSNRIIFSDFILY